MKIDTSELFNPDNDGTLLLKMNDMIAEFMGGEMKVLINGSTIWQFDKPKTPEYAMKCPPFGLISRTNESGMSMMQYDFEWKWLMAGIKKCYDHSADSVNLKALYDQIHLNIYHCAPIINVFMSVCEFIEEYNFQKATA